MRSLAPWHWPVRWRLAAVSAILTLTILVAFALIVGGLATDRLKDDFKEEVEADTADLAASVQFALSPEGVPQPGLADPRLREMVMAGDGAIRIVDASGEPLANTPAEPELGPPASDVERVGEYQVASREVLSNTIGGPFFVQYGRDSSSLDATISRLWLLLAGGVLGGTILATMAGLWVAGRAMRPIAGLTAAAREIATTRDPSLRLPMPESDDEVAELAATLDEMLRQLDAARGETEQMIQAQREFVADASHELRTPLTSVLANLELLEERLAHDHGSEEREIVAGALGSSRRMRRLVSDLLLLARADAGRAGPRRSCDLVEVVEGALAEVAPVAGEHELTSSTPASPVPIDGNPDDLHRLVLNLLENGIRHTPGGSRIQISVEIESRSRSAMLEVTDDGPGLPEDAGDGIFARFVRGGGPADVAVDTGTGLGLAIVKAVAISHGGAVEAGRSDAGGAIITVRLPLDEQALTAAPVQPHVTAG